MLVRQTDEPITGGAYKRQFTVWYLKYIFGVNTTSATYYVRSFDAQRLYPWSEMTRFNAESTEGLCHERQPEGKCSCF